MRAGIVLEEGMHSSVKDILANVDPIDVARSIARLNPETTLSNCGSFEDLYNS
ncbi:unnamed protein product [Prunus armeniaca]